MESKLLAVIKTKLATFLYVEWLYLLLMCVLKLRRSAGGYKVPASKSNSCCSCYVLSRQSVSISLSRSLFFYFWLSLACGTNERTKEFFFVRRRPLLLLHAANWRGDVYVHTYRLLTSSRVRTYVRILTKLVSKEACSCSALLFSTGKWARRKKEWERSVS